MNNNPLKSDLDHILTHTRYLWEELRGQRVFITGGTGFFGCWLLESFAWANDNLNLNAEALVLSRSPEAFERKAPHLYHHPTIQFLKGNVQDFDYPDGQFSHLIHCAVYQQPTDVKASNLSMVNEMLTGTKRVFEFCDKANIKKMLLISTGAVYGKVPSQMEKIPEDLSSSFGPTINSSAYHHVRRMMESLAVLYAVENTFEVKIARCFSFIGPYLPLNGRFAVSDFILDAISERPVTVKGDGKAVRSYLYMADLAIWLWSILFKGTNCKPYNVGSECPTTIRAIAEAIDKESEAPFGVSILGEFSDGDTKDHYVPDTARAQSEIGVRQFTPLTEAVRRTMGWHRKHYSRMEIHDV